MMKRKAVRSCWAYCEEGDGYATGTVIKTWNVYAEGFVGSLATRKENCCNACHSRDYYFAVESFKPMDDEGI